MMPKLLSAHFPATPAIPTALAMALTALVLAVGVPEPPARAAPAEKAQVVPLTPQPPFWSRDAKLISYKCKDMKLVARSRVSPSTVYNLTEGLFNEQDCKSSIATLESKGCFCDGGALKCLETEKVEPLGIVCPSAFYCFQFRGEKLGLVKLKKLGDHHTRGACEKELTELERD